MGKFADDEIEAAFQSALTIQRAQDWSGYCDVFTEDAVYVEHALGTYVGREAIREWLVPVMAPLVGWEYPERWHLVGDDRVVFFWDNIMPTPPGTDEQFLFSGITILTYAGDGLWSREEDIYNEVEMQQVLQRWMAAGGQLGAS